MLELSYINYVLHFCSTKSIHTDTHTFFPSLWHRLLDFYNFPFLFLLDTEYFPASLAIGLVGPLDWLLDNVLYEPFPELVHKNLSPVILLLFPWLATGCKGSSRGLWGSREYQGCKIHRKTIWKASHHLGTSALDLT